MHKFSTYFEYAYLVIGVVFFVEGVLKWTEEPEKAYLSLGFGVLSFFMFFLKLRFRKKRS